MRPFVKRLLRLTKKKPTVVLSRLKRELVQVSEIWAIPVRQRYWSPGRILRSLEETSIEVAWLRLSAGHYPFLTSVVEDFEVTIDWQDRARIWDLAEQAMQGRVGFLGSDVVTLSRPIDWSRDHRSGHRWRTSRLMHWDYNDFQNPSDVKFPWELSRMQWLIPVGQRYVLEPNDVCAEYVKATIRDWIRDNPVGISINWACTMDVAIRAVTWTWFFHVFWESESWREPEFRSLFVTSLFHHGLFIERNLETSDVNGNHLLADAAGLVFLGYFFLNGAPASRWVQQGREILEDEITKQVFPDGVDHEGSIPYHRLAQELLLFPARFAQVCGQPFSKTYLDCLSRMAAFTCAYTRPDGSAPLFGDADDGRLLPFGLQAINDHRYLLPLSALTTGERFMGTVSEDSNVELMFLLDRAAQISDLHGTEHQTSRAFEFGGFYVLRNNRDHVMVDCGPVGLQGRGGHGHNDALSFEAVLDGKLLIVDSGSYVYTADFRARNRFRSTSSHNTPMIDGEEINRLIDEKLLWLLQDEANPEVLEMEFNRNEDRLVMRHLGYYKLDDPVVVHRHLSLNHNRHDLTIDDAFEAKQAHAYVVPYHLAPGVRVESASEYCMLLRQGCKSFRMEWGGSAHWGVEIRSSEYSPSYGVLVTAQQIIFSRNGDPASLRVVIAPQPCGV